MDEVREGLEGVIACATELSDVDGERGRLVIRGYDVEELAPRVVFEDAFVLLRRAAVPDPEVRARLVAALGAARTRAFARLDRDVLAFEDAMDALRSAVARIPAQDDDADAIEIAGTIAVTLAAWVRARRQEAAIAPDPALRQAEDLLRMIDGAACSPGRARALDTYLVTVADHGLNASTFAARVVASTGSDMVSAQTAAIGALKGPLHGGAPGPVLDMLDAIGSPIVPLPGSRASSPRAAVSWAWATASTASVIRGPRCSSRRSRRCKAVARAPSASRSRARSSAARVRC